MRIPFILSCILALLAQAHAQTPTWSWATRFTGSLNVDARGIAASTTDGCFVHGVFSPDLYLPFDTLTQEPLGGFFVAHVDGTGSIAWVVQFTDPIIALQGTASGAVDCLVRYSGSTSVNGTEFVSGGSAISYLQVELDSNGTMIGSLNLPDVLETNGEQLQILAAQNAEAGIAIAGTCMDSVAVAGNWIHGPCLFLARFDGAGQLLWAGRKACDTYVLDGALALNSDGSIGVGLGPACDGDTVPGDGSVVTFDPNGTWSWSTTNVLDQFQTVALNWGGDHYLWASTAMASLWNAAVAVTPLATNGLPDWSTVAQADMVVQQYVCSVEPLSHGAALLSGRIIGPVHFGNITVSANSGPEGFVAMIDSSGEWLWAQHAIGGQFLVGFSSAPAPGARTFVAGTCMMTTVIGNDTIHAVTEGGFVGVVACLDESPLGVTAAAGQPFDQLQLWPDPAVDVLHIPLPWLGPIKLVDALGRDRTMDVVAMGSHVLDVSRLNTGAYILSVGALRTRFIKE